MSWFEKGREPNATGMVALLIVVVVAVVGVLAGRCSLRQDSCRKIDRDWTGIERSVFRYRRKSTHRPREAALRLKQAR